MAYVDLIPGRAQLYVPGMGWMAAPGALTNDTTYTAIPSGQPLSTVMLDKFSAGLPQDITITGIEARMYLSCAPSALNVQVSAYMGSASTVLTATKISTGLTTTDTLFVLGDPTDTWNYAFKRPKIHGNPLFNLVLGVDGSTSVVRRIQYAFIRVHYTLNTYLRGERSVFPPALETWPVYSPTDNIPRKYNGAGPEHQVQSEHINLLGDCLYTLETAVLNASGYVRTLGEAGFLPRTLLCTTVTVTGNFSSSLNPNGYGFLSYHQRTRVGVHTGNILLSDTVVRDTTVTLSNVKHQSLSLVPWAKTYGGVYSRAVGWVETAANGIVGLHVTPSTLRLQRDNSTSGVEDAVDISFGLTAHRGYYSMDNTLSNLDHGGCIYVPGMPPDGRIFLKMFSIGEF
jgi:hypothetical protein